ncbi:MAG: hypothetical protein KatS3mg077_2802 [Candidatus Binatia bacterium]|nr:MAG: hypothetical protein KatS3mg077_2802 [Candidatus Binatia bacterium]
MKDQDICRTRAEVPKGDAGFLLGRAQYRLGGGNGCPHDVRHLDAALFAAPHHIADGGQVACDHVHARFQAHSGHSRRVFDALLIVEHVILRQHVKHMAIRREGHRPRGVHDP